MHLANTITRQFTNGFYHATRTDLDNVNYLIEIPWLPFVSLYYNDMTIVAGGRFDADGFNLRIINDPTYTGALEFQIWAYIQPI